MLWWIYRCGRYADRFNESASMFLSQLSGGLICGPYVKKNREMGMT